VVKTLIAKLLDIEFLIDTIEYVVLKLVIKCLVLNIF